MSFGPHLAHLERDLDPGRAANDPSSLVDVSSQAGGCAPAVLWQRFSVPYAFPVLFTRGLFDEDNALLQELLGRHEPGKQHRFLVFLDRGVAEADPELVARIERWAETRSESLALVETPLLIDGGEQLKREWASLEPMRQAIHRQSIDRHSFIVAIGGGALLDAAGLVAATAHRGIRLIRVPSTVLAQNDSGVGVKNGINQFEQKNYLGTFAPPDAVINDAALLDSLSPRERRNGFAEAVKVALIRDGAFFTWLEEATGALSTFEPAAVHHLIRRCAELHMHQIGRGGDPFELGSARPLDFGHWAAHRLETLTGHELSHGEAVAIGIALDTHYSVLAGHLTPGEDERVARLLERLGFRLWHEALDSCDADGRRTLLTGLEDFRIHLGGELTITLLEGIGHGVEVHAMDDDLLLASIDWLRTFA